MTKPLIGTGYNQVPINGYLGRMAYQDSASVKITGGTATFTDASVISTNSTSAALRITQTGTGHALVVEDSTNPDSTPFVVDASGAVGIGTASPGSLLDVAGNIILGTQTNRATLTYTTNTARTYTIPDAGANANFVMTAGDQSIAGAKTFTGDMITTRGNSTTTGGGQIYLNGASGNRIDFNTNGVAAPSFTTRSAGTKLVLYPLLSGSGSDYALGIDSGTLWYSVPNTSTIHRWYGGTTSLMSLSGTGLDVSVDLTIADRIIHSGDTNTQIRFPAADTVTVETNGSERLRVDSAGNMSIGTTGGDFGRSWRLVVRQDQNATTQFGVINTNVGAGAGAQITKIGGTAFSFVDWALQDLNGSPLDTFAYGSGVLAARWSLGGSERMRITNAGNVGIGTNNPQAKLDVVGSIRISAGNGFQWYGAGGGIDQKYWDAYSINTSANTLFFRAVNDAYNSANPWLAVERTGFQPSNIIFYNGANSERMRITDAGNVGIGTNNPTAKLDVNGDIKTNGALVATTGKAIAMAMIFG